MRFPWPTAKSDGHPLVDNHCKSSQMSTVNAFWSQKMTCGCFNRILSSECFTIFLVWFTIKSLFSKNRTGREACQKAIYTSATGRHNNGTNDLQATSQHFKLLLPPSLPPCSYTYLITFIIENFFPLYMIFLQGSMICLIAELCQRLLPNLVIPYKHWNLKVCVLCLQVHVLKFIYKPVYRMVCLIFEKESDHVYC